MYHCSLLWLIVSFFFLLFEMGHPGLFFFLSFACGAGLASIVSLFPLSFELQILIFLIGTIISVYGLKRWIVLSKKVQNNTNVSALLGKVVLVVTNISPENPGSVKFDGTVWTAYTHQESFVKGDRVIIHAVHGAHVVVRSVTKPKH